MYNLGSSFESELIPSRLVRMYQSWVEGIDDDNNWENDTTQAVITRSLIEDVWSQLTPQEQRVVLATDDVLAAHWQLVAELLLDPQERPRIHWWWYLHEDHKGAKQRAKSPTQLDRVRWHTCSAFHRSVSSLTTWHPQFGTCARCLAPKNAL